MIRASPLFGDPLASFDPMLECSTFLIFRILGQTRHHVISSAVRVEHRRSSELFFDTTKQVEIADGEIWKVSRVWDASAAQARHLVNNRM
jgi:hypothetical protein